MNLEFLICTDPDNLQFCIEVQKGKIYDYFQFDKDRNDLTRKIFDRYSGYPNQLIEDAKKNQGLKDAISEIQNWYNELIDVDTISPEDIKEISSSYGIDKKDYTDNDYNQLMCEGYFELYCIY
jgi:hypothetical protein